jgi:cyclopropane fatty-acyl-phospholipid synthase-like methyltransferase
MIIDKNFKDQLRAAYDTDANRRTANSAVRSDWKLAARQQFADAMKLENKKTILEIGAGVGTDAKYFQEQGFEVLATDLSPK